MAHPPAVTSDLTYIQFIDGVIAVADRGLKLDFKDTHAVDPGLALIELKSLFTSALHL